MDESGDPFGQLGLARRFEISAAQLQAAYLKRAAALHPDRFTDPIAQAEAATQAARLNQVRDVLADDERRANVLLRLLSGPEKQQDKSLPEGFLTDMMDMRQEMEEALASGDPAQRARLEQWASQRRNEYKKLVATLFQNITDCSSSRSPSPESLHEIRTNLNAWRYIERMIEQLDSEYQAQA